MENNKYYHATYRPLLKKIMTHGLNPNYAQKNYYDSQKGFIYLTNNIEMAKTFAETAELIPYDWITQVVIIQADLETNDPKLLPDDSCCAVYLPEGIFSFKYQGIIDPNKLTIIE